MTSIRIEPTNKVLSVNGGLVVFKKLVEKLNLERHISSILPRGKKTDEQVSFRKLYQILMGFFAGADCLDHLDRLANDKMVRLTHDKLFASNTVGEFLREFSEAQVKELNHKLIDVSLTLRDKVGAKKDKRFILDIDSTDHEQHGKKIEGVGFNKDGLWGLNSIQAYDNCGFSYWFEAREAATHTSVGATEIISTVFRKAKSFYPKRESKFFILRADSGYSNSYVFEACFTAGVKFVVCMRSDMFMPLLEKQDPHWKRTSLKTRDNREFEIGEVVYKPENAREVMRVVLLRAPTKDGLLDSFDYYGWVTNLYTHDMHAEDVVRLYRGRGNAENFIKESKGSFDLRHFPCQKLTANKCYGVIGAMAQSLMRFMAFIEDPFHPKFAKNLRFRMVALPCEVVTHARQATVRFMHHHYKEVFDWINKLHKINVEVSIQI